MNRLSLAFLLALFATPNMEAMAQVISINASNTKYSQNFDDLTRDTSASGYIQFTTVPGAFAVQRGNGTTTELGEIGSIRASDGSGSLVGLFSFGSPNSGDRALGTIAGSASGSIGFGFVFHNDTGGSISGAAVSYTGEQWRYAGGTLAQTLTFSYAVSGASAAPTTTQLAQSIPIGDAENLVPTGYKAVENLYFTSPTLAGANGSNSASALNGNDSANSRQLSAVINFATPLAADEYLTFYFTDINSVGNDHGLAIDNFSVAFNAAPVPEPATTFAVAAGVLGLVGFARRRLRGKPRAS